MDGEMNAALAAGNRAPIAGYQAKHFIWEVAGKVATVTLNRPERKNPLTFESYAELRDLFRRIEERSRRQLRHRSRARARTSAPAATCTRSSVR